MKQAEIQHTSGNLINYLLGSMGSLSLGEGEYASNTRTISILNPKESYFLCRKVDFAGNYVLLFRCRKLRSRGKRVGK